MRKLIYVCLICALLFCCCGGYASAPVSAQDSVAVPILLYHNVINYIPEGDYDSSLNIPASVFEKHMQAVLRAGYTPITYEMYYRFETEGAPLPDKPIMITFDDGYLSNYIYAYPILKKLGIKATIFVITDRRGKALSINPHFSWNQAKEMVDSGIIDIQSHTHSHQVSTTLTDEALIYELTVSKRLVERYTGKKCNVLAFPNGIAEARELEAAKRAGYKIINLVGERGSNRKGDDLATMKRITVFGKWSAQELLERVNKNLFL